MGRNQRFDVTNAADYVFWCGDLNYRVNLPRDASVEFNLLRSWDVLFANDQLQQEMAAERCFNGFQEGELLFPCTYRYERGTRNYTMVTQRTCGLCEHSTCCGTQSKKCRVPSWCDRILWKHKPNYKVELSDFNCVQSIMTR